MNENSKKEEFSYAYIHALTASFGYIIIRSDRAMDNRGFDCEIIGDEVEGVGAPRLMVQIKCTTPKYFEEFEDFYKYDLKVKNYNKLRQRSIDRSILIIVIVPEESEEWIKVSNNQTILQKNAYYISLEGSPETSNTKTIKISIPKVNLLTQESLRQLLSNVSDLRSKSMKIMERLKMGT
jgi:hypothetical protein